LGLSDPEHIKSDIKKTNTLEYDNISSNSDNTSDINYLEYTANETVIASYTEKILDALQKIHSEINTNFPFRTMSDAR